MIALFVATIVVLSFKQSNAEYVARVWKNDIDKYPVASDFPENKLLANKPNTGIAFTGGGSRAFSAAMGYLSALTKLDLIKNVRYITGISGGAWATLAYTFVRNISDDEVFLGPIIPPEQLTRDNVKIMDPKCARSYTSYPIDSTVVEAFHSGSAAADAWIYGVSKAYIEPAGIEPNHHFSWNADSVNDIISRNPSLSAKDFYLPKDSNRPFPIVGTAIVGPVKGAPYDAATHNMTFVEVTPLYVGHMRTLEVAYTYRNDHLPHVRTIGGIVEPFAFAIHGSAPTTGIAAGQKTALLSVPEPTQHMDIQTAAGASSYAIGSYLESLDNTTLNNMGMHVDYWSPVLAAPTAEDTFFTDGGSFENIALISLMQRRVEKIVLFYNSAEPMLTAEKWNVATDEYTTEQISDDFPAFFGVFPPLADSEARTYQYQRNQVFTKNDFVRVITEMQRIQAQGNGIFATFNLTTIENAWWGIPAGLTFQITFVYLGRIPAWEKLLTPEMKLVLVPKSNVDDLSQDVSSGPFSKFPHYPTGAGDVNFERANALADLTGWSLLQHEDMFRQILQ